MQPLENVTHSVLVPFPFRLVQNLCISLVSFFLYIHKTICGPFVHLALGHEYAIKIIIKDYHYYKVHRFKTLGFPHTQRCRLYVNIQKIECNTFPLVQARANPSQALLESNSGQQIHGI